jgi:hypothetical protein
MLVEESRIQYKQTTRRVEKRAGNWEAGTTVARLVKTMTPSSSSSSSSFAILFLFLFLFLSGWISARE